MEDSSKLGLIVEQYFKKAYRLHKPKDANGEEINQWFEFKSRADFLKAYLDFYRGLPSFREAIIWGCSAKFKLIYNGREYELKHTHQEEFKDNKGAQHGVNNLVLSSMASKLLPLDKELESTRSFDEVYEIIKDAKVQGFGELSIYDAAVRISAYLGFAPNLVYLHAGAREGAKYLEEKGLLPVDASMKEMLSLDDFPEPIRKLESIQVENFLCSFKNDLKKI
jgi:hypothetical protein